MLIGNWDRTTPFRSNLRFAGILLTLLRDQLALKPFKLKRF